MAKWAKLMIAILMIALVAYLVYSSGNTTSVATEYPLTVQELKPVCEIAFAQSQLHGIFEYEGYSGDYQFFYEKNILCSAVLTAKRGYIWDSMNITIDTINRTVKVNATPTWLSVDVRCQFLRGDEGILTSLSPHDYNRADSLARHILLSKVDTAELNTICVAGLQNFLYSKLTGKKYTLLY